eukprot:gnl/TRDRNA2_/TRDRNA2_75420_c0_seq1.p1 gnl/TRDRNA2_/TRDRNA2_75420_c0~~gnl/TRDRNA2_/TRDRNA2_75420_c0_seq1.p1  ORF type:complete len:343 (-),score=70.82 gnl/TRDRNA2_/TRDRNA2_75420_c0_seq1:95-1123(-)
MAFVSALLPYRSFVVLAGALAALSNPDLERDLRPDKKDDAWTTSSRFKHDLVEMFPHSTGETVLELGAHVGHCTRVLSRLFGAVIAVEHSEAVLEKNVNNTSDLSNIVHLNLHTVLDSWDVFSKSRIGVVFIDAAHDYHSVKSDIERALELPLVHTLVLDDYGAEKGVKQAVSDMLATGRVRLRRHVGEAPPWTFSDRVVNEWEGVVLDPVRPTADEQQQAEAALRSAPSAMLENTTWLVFPAGVFVSGYFQPHGKIFFDSGGVAASSYGVLAWRHASEYAESGVSDAFAMALEEPPGWRADMKLNARRTAAVLFRSDGQQLVMLRQEMMRTVGEKLLSFMH